MPRFSYSARSKAGASVSDQLDAPSRRDALRILATRGLTVSALNEAGTEKSASKKKASSASKAGPEKKSFSSAMSFSVARQVEPGRSHGLPFLQTLYDLTSSGLSAGEAVRLLSVRLKDPGLKVLCQRLWESISEGAPLSSAMAAHSKVFSNSTINLIAAGEATGSLNDTLSRLITHLNEQRDLKRQLLAALAYPVFMFVVATGVILFFLFYLLPRMQGLLTSLGGRLPASTQFLISTSNFALHYGVFIIIGLVLGGIFFWRWHATNAGRHTVDSWMLDVPVLGSLITSQSVLAISQTLSVLLENGITTAEALKMTERQIENVLHRAAFAEATARVLEGEALSLALGRTKCFPDLVLDRIAVGENTGNVVPSLKDIAKNYRAHISQQLQGLTRVIAGLVMCMVFVFVGFIAFAIVSAVFQMSASFNRGH